MYKYFIELDSDLRLALKEHVTLPSPKVLSVAENEILPLLEPFEFGWKVNLLEAVTITLKRFFEQHDSIRSECVTLKSEIQCLFVGGCDGSGGHSIYNSETSLAENVDTSHMLFAGFSLTELKTQGEEKVVLFKDNHVASSNAERPWLLILGKESKENFGKVIKVLDADIQEVVSSQIIITDIVCKIVFNLSQLDGKAITTASGLGGAYCTCCKVSEAEAKLPERIEQRLLH